MERSEKIKSLSTKRSVVDKNLPTLKSSMISNKGMIAISISKVDFDSRIIHRQKYMKPTVQNVEKEPLRSQSGFSLRKNKQISPTTDTKNQTKMQFDMPSSTAFKLHLKDIREQIQSQATTQPIAIDKSKISAKTYGMIKGYSANSHPGPILTYNEDRICIITNLTKTNIRQKQISFFGVYDGNDGINKADYLRDNYHLMMIQDEAFPQQMELAMKRTLKKINNNFSSDNRFSGDQSSVSFAMVVVANQDLYYMQSGGCKSVFSQNLGENIYYPSKTESSLIREVSKKTKSVSQLLKRVGKSQRQAMNDLQFKHCNIIDGLDYILLGSEGVFENLRVKELGRKLWLYILRNKEESVHFSLGEANNCLLHDVFTSLGTKNASIIIICFEGVAKCFERQEQREIIQLPYVNLNTNQSSRQMTI